MSLNLIKTIQKKFDIKCAKNKDISNSNKLATLNSLDLFEKIFSRYSISKKKD